MVQQFYQLILLLKDVITEQKDYPKLAEATSIIANLTSEEGSQAELVHHLSSLFIKMVCNTIQRTLGDFINSIDVDGQARPWTVSEY